MGRLLRAPGAIAHYWNMLRYYVDSQPVTQLTEFEKRDHIESWARATGYRVFVETGTYLGKTTLRMAEIFDRCFTIELSEELHGRAAGALAGCSNVRLYCGNSGDLIPSVLAQIDEPAIFWLDAHYSGGVTGKGAVDTPIEDELQAIIRHNARDHVILVDDARLFLRKNSYPGIKDLHRLLRGTQYTMRIRDDILRIYREDI